MSSQNERTQKQLITHDELVAWGERANKETAKKATKEARKARGNMRNMVLMLQVLIPVSRTEVLLLAVLAALYGWWVIPFALYVALLAAGHYFGDKKL